MIECPACGRSHRTEEIVARCAARLQRKLQRAEKMAADEQRRADNKARESARDFISREYCREAISCEKVAAHLNKDYPPRPDGKKWHWTDVLAVHCEHLNWG